MSTYKPLRVLPKPAPYTQKDVLVIFGQVFGRGYVNGIIDEAVRLGMKIIGGTVGMRNASGELVELDAENLQKAKSAAPFTHFINVPLEAGFDFEKAKSGRSPFDQLQGFKMDEWETLKLNWQDIQESRAKGTERFRMAARRFLVEVEKLVPADSNIIFVHTMAGGIPRAKIFMPTLNKIFKGKGERYLSSERFWNCDMGKLCDMSFDDVTAHTFRHLLDLSTGLRERQEKNGARASYLAYSYHGTEICIRDEFRWQSYSPYLQGFAKMKLEQHARDATLKGIHACVFNAPEILTNSSNLFQGIEIPLYQFIRSLEKVAPHHPLTKARIDACSLLLKDGITLADVYRTTDEYFGSDLIKGEFTNFEKWPQHNRKDQMELMLKTSDQVVEFHKDERATMTLELSRDIFDTTGYLMLHEAWQPQEPVWWLGHDVLAKTLTRASS